MIKVVAAIIYVENKFYISQRSGGFLDKKWEFPGGKIEAGESEITALKREIKEELDCEINIVNRFDDVKYSYPSVDINLITYICTVKSGVPKSKEHSQEKWISKDEFVKYDFAEADIDTINKILASF